MSDETLVVRAPLYAGARTILLTSMITAAAWLSGCASTATQETAPPSQHGVMSDRTAASNARLCAHKIPADVCVKCHPELASEYKVTGDWCPGHDVPESQCFACHSDLSFEPLPTLKTDADWQVISIGGTDVPDLGTHAALGKVTIFDFYAVWCAPCRKVDGHMIGVVNGRDDVAVRKLDMANWESPLAKRYLHDVKSLPHVIVYGKDGRQVAVVNGFDLDGLDAAIAKASQPEVAQ